MPIEVQAVFSNVGEPTTVKPQSERVMRVVVFGACATRHRALQPLRGFAQGLAEQGVVEIVEVGPGSAFKWAEQSLTHRHVGRLASTDLSKLLEDSAYGLIDYPAAYMGKSTVLAAYAAHGCVVLNTHRIGKAHGEARDCISFFNLLAGESVPITARDRAAPAKELGEWYAPHNLSRNARSLASMCCEGLNDMVSAYSAVPLQCPREAG
jgi:hypothetical protein